MVLIIMVTCKSSNKIIISYEKQLGTHIQRQCSKDGFCKRKTSVYKEADELSKLCDIGVALVVTKLIKRRGLGQFSWRRGRKIQLNSIAFSTGTRLPRMLLPRFPKEKLQFVPFL
ncbi:hypothetical protein ACFX11_020418 [Malus domestica]